MYYELYVEKQTHQNTTACFDVHAKDIKYIVTRTNSPLRRKQVSLYLLKSHILFAFSTCYFVD